jgi:hypothetical protein
MIPISALTTCRSHRCCFGAWTRPDCADQWARSRSVRTELFPGMGVVRILSAEWFLRPFPSPGTILCAVPCAQAAAVKAMPMSTAHPHTLQHFVQLSLPLLHQIDQRLLRSTRPKISNPPKMNHVPSLVDCEPTRFLVFQPFSTIAQRKPCCPYSILYAALFSGSRGHACRRTEDNQVVRDPACASAALFCIFFAAANRSPSSSCCHESSGYSALTQKPKCISRRDTRLKR